MLTETITDWATHFLDTTGYAGAALLMALESMIAPVPSEAVMPFVGFLVADGKWQLCWSILATSLGSIAGSFASYIIGYYGGKPLVLKVGRYLLLRRHDLEMTERFFQRRSGVLAVFIARFVPVIRHFISVPAGIGKMPVIPFLAVSALGATLWNSFLLTCGMKLRDHWGIVQRYSHGIDIVVLAVLALCIAAFLWHRLRHRGRTYDTL